MNKRLTWPTCLAVVAVVQIRTVAERSTVLNGTSSLILTKRAKRIEACDVFDEN